MKPSRGFSILALAAFSAGLIALSACKRGLAPDQKKQLKEAETGQYQTLHQAARTMREEWGAAVAEVQVLEIGSGFIEIRKRDVYDAEGKRVAVQFCKIVGDVLPAGSIRVQVFDEARKNLLGIAYCYDHSGRSDALTKARQVE